MKNIFFALFSILIMLSCQTKEKEIILPTTPSFSQFECEPNPNGWSVPAAYISNDGAGLDFIPVLDSPQYVLATDVNFLQDDELVIGAQFGNFYKAFPHRIMDHHEVVNEIHNNINTNEGDGHYSITFCPLAGSAIGFRSDDFLENIAFGVSGELYNSNLIMYDRATNSLWSQMLQIGINGEYSCEELSSFQLIETTWENWKTMFPESSVLSFQDDFDFEYEKTPYSSRVTGSNSLFAEVHPLDTRLPLYERAHGIVKNNFAKSYPIQEFTEEIQIIEESIPNDVIIVGSSKRNFAVSFLKKLDDDGTLLDFEAVQDGGAIILRDLQEGNLWNIFGEAVEGDRVGQRLIPTTSFNAYWFAWGAFFPGIEIYDFDDEDG